MASTSTDLSLVGIEGLLSVIPGGGAVSEALKGYRERKIAEARNLLIEEVRRGNLVAICKCLRQHPWTIFLASSSD